MRILFWGTPDFAVPPLRALLGEGHDVIGVVTRADVPRGRSRSLLDPSSVKVVALAEGIPVLQPDKPKGDEFLAEMRALEPDVSVVVAYGRILPQAVIDLPTLGTLNIHGSILPALRGAAPLQAAILQGLEETGVTIMQMVYALDAGPMLQRRQNRRKRTSALHLQRQGQVREHIPQRTKRSEQNSFGRHERLLSIPFAA